MSRQIQNIPALLAVLFIYGSLSGVQGLLYPDVGTAIQKLKLPTFAKIWAASLEAGDASSKVPDLSSATWIGTALLPSETGWGLLTKTWDMSLADILKNPTLCKAIVQYHIIPRFVVRLSSFPPIGTVNASVQPTMLVNQGLQTGRGILPGSAKTPYFYVQGKANRAVVSPTYKDLMTAKGVVQLINVALIPDLQQILTAKPAPALDEYNKTASTVLAYINSQPNLSYLAQALQIVGPVTHAFIGSTAAPFTYFAPVNSAFVTAAKQMGLTTSKAGTGDVSKLFVKSYLPQILAGLTVGSETLTPKDLTALKTLTTTLPSTLLINNLNGNLTVTAKKGTAHVISPPLYISEAVLYLVDNVIMGF